MDSETVYLVIFTLIFFVEFVANTTVLVLFYLERKSRTISQYYVISLTFSDFVKSTSAFLASASFIVYLVFEEVKVNELRTYIFVILIISWVCFSLCSFFNLVLTAIDRYWAILHPMHYKTHATKQIARSE